MTQGRGTRRGDLEALRMRLRRELSTRRRMLKARAYQAAFKRLRDAASDYARELSPHQAPEFLARVLEALAVMPQIELERPERTIPKPTPDSAVLDELVIGELVESQEPKSPRR